MAVALSAEDKKWQRESDARTLAEAEQIKQSPTRMKGAKVAAKKMATEQQKQAQSLKKVAGAKPKTKPRTPRKTPKRKK